MTRRFPLLTLLALAAGCGPSAANVATGIASENPAVRGDMVAFARKFDDPAVVQALVGVLGDPSEQTRIDAVKSLAEIGDPLACSALVELLATDPSERVQRETIDALGRLKDPIGVDALLALAERSSDDKIPLNAIWALGNLGDKRALPLLSRLREGSRDPYVVFNANVALRKIR
jgi:HEAT repeat protein